MAETRFDSPVVRRGGILQDGGLRGESDFQFLLIGVERLAGEVDRGLRCLHGGAVLFHVELRVADLDAHLILQLVQAHLRLAVFQFARAPGWIARAVAQRNIERQVRRPCRARWS